MESTASDARFSVMPDRMDLDDYNYEHFRTRHLLHDAAATVEGKGIQPGHPAPDFELSRAGGGTLKLSDLRGKPVLLHFGSPT